VLATNRFKTRDVLAVTQTTPRSWAPMPSSMLAGSRAPSVRRTSQHRYQRSMHHRDINVAAGCVESDATSDSVHSMQDSKCFSMLARACLRGHFSRFWLRFRPPSDLRKRLRRRYPDITRRPHHRLQVMPSAGSQPTPGQGIFLAAGLHPCKQQTRCRASSVHAGCVGRSASAESPSLRSLRVGRFVQHPQIFCKAFPSVELALIVPAEVDLSPQSAGLPSTRAVHARLSPEQGHCDLALNLTVRSGRFSLVPT
jgi:hypothetical protein